MELSQKLKELRKKQGLTQLELAERLFVSRQAISGWEAGTSRPSTENLQSLSRLFNIPLETLLDDTAEAEPAAAPEKLPAEEQAKEEGKGQGLGKDRRYKAIERQNADRQMNEEKKNAAYQIRQVRDQAVKEIAEMQGALAQAQKDAAYQRHLNENLLRISRERANADRGLKPKKEHTGYVVMNMQEKKLQRKNSRGYYTITLWETVLQSPYSVDFTEEQARYQIHEDLMQHEDGKEWALSRIGICEKPDPKFCDPFEYNEIMENENVLVRYQLRANYQARRGEKTGFWDIILVHQKPIPQVPKDMRP